MSPEDEKRSTAKILISFKCVALLQMWSNVDHDEAESHSLLLP